MSNYTGPLLTPEEQAQALHALVKVVGDSNIEHINGVASVVWVSYDILLTMRQEVDLMWNERLFSRWSLFYFFVRYFSFGYLVFNAQVMTSNTNTAAICAGWGVLLAVSATIVSTSVNGLLGARVCAFFHGDTKVKWAILVIWIMETIVEIVVTTITRVEAGKSIPWPSQLPISGCLSGTQLHTPLSSLSSWIASTVYSVICFSLITYRFLAVYINGNVTSELAETFIRDGFILFTMVCGSIVLNIILLYVFPDSVMVTMGLSWLIGASSIASSRTILSLREAARHKSGLTSEYELPQLQSGPVMISPANVVRLPRSYGGPSFFSRGNHDAGDTTLNLHQVESWSSNVRST